MRDLQAIDQRECFAIGRVAREWEWEREDVNSYHVRMTSGVVLCASSVGLAAVMASTAAADYSMDVVDFVASGFEFYEWTEDGEYLMGSLDDAVGAFVLNEDAENLTWCDDLTVLIADADFDDIFIQIGGYSDTGATYHFGWPFGSDGAEGTNGGGDVDIGDLVVDGYKLYLGNGYLGGGDGNWTGTIDLNGSIAIVPATGSLALLGFAGIVLRRRRS